MSRPGPKIPPLSLADAQRAVLEGWARGRTTLQTLAQWSRIAPDTVRTWRRRFLDNGLDGLCDQA
ncbi:helix-turn-helix domain-containing protein [Streptomyces goshikiensis]|uniref:helix-turn-helix domain-containing protein n=1 Tax=Streptomyces goshikiensis TaxID=1942 RepID=UPI00340ADAAD